MASDPNHTLFKEIAEKLVAKMLENITLTIQKGRTPDLHWKMEKALLEALKWSHRLGMADAEEKCKKLLQDFDSNDGSTNN